MSSPRKAVSVLNVAEAKQQLSTLLGRVAFGGETILITRRGRPMGKLVPVSEDERPHLAAVRGWLEADDVFFGAVEDLVEARSTHVPRVMPGGGLPGTARKRGK